MNICKSTRAGILFLLSFLTFDRITAFTVQNIPITRNYAQYPAKFLYSKSDTALASSSYLDRLEGKTLLSVEECLAAYEYETCMKINNEASKEDILSASASALSSASRSPKVIFIDASWWHKGDLNGRELFEEGPRIPGSKYFDIDDICLTPDLNPNSLPHMLPTSNLFAAAMDRYDIHNKDHVIITARESVYFTPRTWFMFKTFGHDPAKIHLMQGSIEQWMEQGGEVDTDPVVAPTFQGLEPPEHVRSDGDGETEGDECFRYTYNYNTREATNVCKMDEVLAAIENNNNQNGEKNDDHTDDDDNRDQVLILDSRGSSFAKGHMPGAIHLPYANWVSSSPPSSSPKNSKTSTLKWKPINELKQIFMDAGVDPLTDQNIICSCGTGVSVCHTLLALELCGRDLQNQDKTTMYDASWSEWGKMKTNPRASL